VFNLVVMKGPAPDRKARVTLRIVKDSRRRAAYVSQPARKNVRFVALGVHTQTVASAVAEHGREVRSLGTMPDCPESGGHTSEEAR